MRQVPSVSRRQLLSGALAATLGLTGCNALPNADAGVPDDPPDCTAKNATSTLILTETTTHAVTSASSNPGYPTTATETTSTPSATTTTTSSPPNGSGGACGSTTTSTTTPSTTTTTTTTSESAEIIRDGDERHIEDVIETESYDAIEWHPGGILVIEEGAGLELTESTT